MKASQVRGRSWHPVHGGLRPLDGAPAHRVAQHRLQLAERGLSLANEAG
jgi:hypothetical protein